MTNSGPDQTVIPTWCCYYLQRLYSHSHGALCFIANQMAFQFTIFYVEVPCFGWNKTWWSHDYSTFMCLLYQFMFLMIHIKVSLTNNLRMITQRLVIEMVFSFSQASASFSRPSMFSWYCPQSHTKGTAFISCYFIHHIYTKIFFFSSDTTFIF